MRRLRTRRARTSVSEGVNNTQHADSAERCSVLNQTRGGEGRIGRMRREISVLPPAPAIAPATGIEQPPPIAVAPAPAPIPAPVAAPASEQARRRERVQSSSEFDREMSGFRVEHVPGDGSCLFSSIASQLNRLYSSKGDGLSALDVRQLCVGELEDNKKQYSRFHASHDEDFEAYLARMARPNEWGDELVIRAACERFSVRATIYDCTTKRKLQYRGQEFVGEIFLHKTGNEDENNGHYNHLLPLDPSAAPPPPAAAAASARGRRPPIATPERLRAHAQGQRLQSQMERAGDGDAADDDENGSPRGGGNPDDVSRSLAQLLNPERERRVTRRRQRLGGSFAHWARAQVQGQNQMERAGDDDAVDLDESPPPPPSPPRGGGDSDDSGDEDNSSEEPFALASLDIDSIETLGDWNECLTQLPGVFDQADAAVVNVFKIKESEVKGKTKLFKDKFKKESGVLLHLGIVRGVYHVYFFGDCRMSDKPEDKRKLQGVVHKAWSNLFHSCVTSASFWARDLSAVRECLMPVSEACVLFDEILRELFAEVAVDSRPAERCLFLSGIGLKHFHKFESIEAMQLPPVMQKFKDLPGALTRIDFCQEYQGDVGTHLHLHLDEEASKACPGLVTHRLLGTSYMNVTRIVSSNRCGINFYSVPERTFLSVSPKLSFRELWPLQERLLKSSTIEKAKEAVVDLGDAVKKALGGYAGTCCSRTGSFRFEISLALENEDDFQTKAIEAVSQEINQFLKHLKGWRIQAKQAHLQNMLSCYSRVLEEEREKLDHGFPETDDWLVKQFVFDARNMLHVLFRGTRQYAQERVWDDAFKSSDSFELALAQVRKHYEERLRYSDEQSKLKHLRLTRKEKAMLSFRTSRVSFQGLAEALWGLFWVVYWDIARRYKAPTQKFAEKHGLDSRETSVLCDCKDDNGVEKHQLEEFVEVIQSLGVKSSRQEFRWHGVIESVPEKEYASRLCTFIKQTPELADIILPKLNHLASVSHRPFEQANEDELLMEVVFWGMLDTRVQSDHVWYFPPIAANGQGWETQYLKPLLIEEYQDDDLEWRLDGNYQHQQEEQEEQEQEQEEEDEYFEEEDEDEEDEYFEEEDEDEEDEYFEEEDEDEEEEDEDFEDEQGYEEEDEDESQGPFEVDAEREERVPWTPPLRSSPASMIWTSKSPCKQANTKGYEVGRLRKDYVELARLALNNTRWGGQHLQEHEYFPSDIQSTKQMKEYRLNAANGLEELIRKREGEGKEPIEFIESAHILIGCHYFRVGGYAGTYKRNRILCIRMDGTYCYNYVRCDGTIYTHIKTMLKNLLALDLVDCREDERFVEPRETGSTSSMDWGRILECFQQALESRDGCMTEVMKQSYIEHAKHVFRSEEDGEPLRFLLKFNPLKVYQSEQRQRENRQRRVQSEGQRRPSHGRQQGGQRRPSHGGQPGGQRRTQQGGQTGGQRRPQQGGQTGGRRRPQQGGQTGGQRRASGENTNRRKRKLYFSDDEIANINTTKNPRTDSVDSLYEPLDQFSD